MQNTWLMFWAEALQRASLMGGGAIVAAFALVRLFKTAPAWAQSWVWRLAFLKLMLALFFASNIELAWLAAPGASPSVRNLSNLTPPDDMTSSRVGALSHDAPPAVALPTAYPAKPTWNWRLIAFGLWMAGAAVAMGRLVFGLRKLRCWVRCSQPHAGWQRWTNGLAREWGLRRIPMVSTCGEISSPLVLGWRRPRLLLPARIIESFAPRQIELMIAHELTHLKRRDLFWNLLPAVARVIFWFHPLVWLGGREWRLAQESACDQMAIKMMKAPVAEYGAMLLSVVKGALSRQVSPPLISATVAGTGHSLGRRVSAMQAAHRLTRRKSIAVAAALLAGTGMAMLPWKLVAKSPDPEPASGARRIEPSSTASAGPSALDAILVDLWRAEARLAGLKSDYTENHPTVRAALAEVEVLREKAREAGYRGPAETAKRENWPRTRELLEKEIDLAQREMIELKRQHEAGRLTLNDLLGEQKELARLKKELGWLRGDPRETELALKEEQKIIREMLEIQKRKIAVGADAPSSTLKLERELLRIERELENMPDPRQPGRVSEPRREEAKQEPSSAQRSMLLSAKRPGIVEEILVKPGDAVRKGTILARIDESPAKAKLRAAESALNVARADLDLEKLQFEQAMLEHERKKKLAEQKLISPDQLQDPEVYRVKLARAQAQFEAVRNQVEDATAEFEQHLIRAPRDGVVQTLYILEGEAIPNLGQPVISLRPDPAPDNQVTTIEALGEGKYRIAGRTHTREELADQIKKLRAQSATAVVTIVADAGVDFASISQLLQLCKEAGIQGINVKTGNVR